MLNLGKPVLLLYKPLHRRCSGCTTACEALRNARLAVQRDAGLPLASRLPLTRTGCYGATKRERDAAERLVLMAV
jgi:hypothetical protein